jgi:hypothetical protein
MRVRSARLRDVHRVKTCVHGKAKETLQDMSAVITVESDSQIIDMFFKMFRDLELIVGSDISNF